MKMLHLPSWPSMPPLQTCWVSPPPTVAPPSAAMQLNRVHTVPWCFLVANLMDEAQEKLIQEQFWSTLSVTFFAIPFAPQVSQHLGAIDNMTFTADDHLEVCKLVQDTILSHAPAIAHVHAHNLRALH